MLIIVGVSLMAMFANSLRLMTICRLFDIRLTVHDSFLAASANSFYNIITPVKSGVAVKGIYLYSIHGMAWSKYFASLGITQILASATSISIAVVMLMAFDVADFRLVLGFALVIGAVAYFAWANLGRFQALLSKSKILANTLAAIGDLSNRNPVLILFVLSHIVYLALISTRLFLVFEIFVPEVEIWQVLLIQAALTATMFISITPGNIGIQEGFVAVASAYLSIDPSVAILASLSERAFLLLTALPVGAVCSITIMRRLGAKNRNQI